MRPLTTTRDAENLRELVLATTLRSQGYGHVPEWHRDIDDPGTYLQPGHAMLLVEEHTGSCPRLVACGGLRPARQVGPAHVQERYAGRTAAEMVRVNVTKGYERRGLASGLVQQLLTHVRQETTYDVVSLHTNTRSPGALEFWLAQGAFVVGDDTQEPDDPRVRTVYLEFPEISRG